MRPRSSRIATRSRDVAGVVRDFEPTLFFCIPTFYAALASSDLAPDTFASVRHAVSAAEPLPADTYHRFVDRFGVQILDFRYPTPEAPESWEQRLGRLFDTLRAGDVLVVVNELALGRTPDEVARTIRTLRRHNLVVKVLSHGAPHLEDARA